MLKPLHNKKEKQATVNATTRFVLTKEVLKNAKITIFPSRLDR